jgi:hypothetical protein
MGDLGRSPKPPALRPPAEPGAFASAVAGPPASLAERNRRTVRVLLAVMAVLMISALLVGIRW